jgi:carbonic anhydrase/acetyltransferase-like protein (isoleucine patch superfamily)
MTLEERLDRYLSQTPAIADSAYVAASAVLIGDVTLGENASIWPGCVVRADIASISIGEGSNIQDGCIVHLADDLPVVVGKHVTVGHGAILHACTIGDECLIGMRATVMDGAEIGPRSIVGAHALVTKGFKAPEGSLIMGCPAKIVKTLDAETMSSLKKWALKYVTVARAHRQNDAKNANT